MTISKKLAIATSALILATGFSLPASAASFTATDTHEIVVGDSNNSSPNSFEITTKSGTVYAVDGSSVQTLRNGEYRPLRNHARASASPSLTGTSVVKIKKGADVEIDFANMMITVDNPGKRADFKAPLVLASD